MQLNTLSISEKNQKSVFKILIPFLIYLLIYLLLFVFDYQPIISYSIVYISVSISFIFLCIYLFKTDVGNKQVYYLLMTGIALRILFLFIHPIGSDDYYRYLWDGKVLAHGINPYMYTPSDEELVSLHSETLPEKVTFSHIKTIYPPLSLVLFYLSYTVGGENYLGLKLMLFVFEMLTLLGLFLILKELKLSPKNILLYALAPLPLFQIFIDAHLDGFGITLIIFSLLFYIKNKKVLSLVFIALSICIKPVALILIPIIFIMEKGAKLKLLTLFIPAVSCAVIYIPFISESTFDALIKFTVNWTFNGFIFEIINAFINNNQVSRIGCAILFLLSFLVIIFLKSDLLNKIYLSIFLLLIFSPVVHPWYLLWIAVLLPFIPKWSGILFTSLISISVITVLNYQLYSEWKNYPLVLIIEYIPVLLMFLSEIKKIKIISKHRI